MLPESQSGRKTDRINKEKPRGFFRPDRGAFKEEARKYLHPHATNEGKNTEQSTDLQYPGQRFFNTSQLMIQGRRGLSQYDKYRSFYEEHKVLLSHLVVFMKVWSNNRCARIAQRNAYNSKVYHSRLKAWSWPYINLLINACTHGKSLSCTSSR